MNEKLYGYVDYVYKTVADMFCYTVNGRGIRAYIGNIIQNAWLGIYGNDRTIVTRAIETNLTSFKIKYK